MMNGGPCQFGTEPECPSNQFGVVQPARAEQVYDEVAPGDAGTHAILKPTDFRTVRLHGNFGLRDDNARQRTRLLQRAATAAAAR